MKTDVTPSLARTTVDVATHHRTDHEWLDKAWSDPATRVLVLDGGPPGSRGWNTPSPRRSRSLVTTEGPRHLVLISPACAPEGERYFLGVDDGIAHFAVRSTDPLTEPEGTAAVTLGEIGALLGDRDTGLLTRAVALANWNATHRFCPRCGGTTYMANAGHMRVCEREGDEQYPRTDPAVIMLVHREKEGREEVLLGNNPRWAAERYSVLAGFVDAGESLEQAVAREVAEEAGVVVATPRYLSSQPWPFPRSLMMGYTALAVGETERTDDEIGDLRWFTRAELTDAVQGGRIRLPGPVSIAHTLIEHWYGAELPGGW